MPLTPGFLMKAFFPHPLFSLFTGQHIPTPLAPPAKSSSKIELTLGPPHLAPCEAVLGPPAWDVMWQYSAQNLGHWSDHGSCKGSTATGSLPNTWCQVICLNKCDKGWQCPERSLPVRKSVKETYCADQVTGPRSPFGRSEFKDGTDSVADSRDFAHIKSAYASAQQ